MTPRVLVLAVVAAAAASTSGAAETAATLKPRNVVRPRIVGTPRAGAPLEATRGTWSPSREVRYSYRWIRCPAGGVCTRIARETHRRYTPASVDVGAKLRVMVTAANAAGSTHATSPRSRVVRPRPDARVVALWRMDETAGTVMRDASGGHNGTLFRVVLGLPGATGTAFGFNGRNSYVSVPSAGALNPRRANITITVRLKTTAVPPPPPSDADLVRKGTYSAASSEYKVELQHSGQASCGFKGSAGYSELIAGPRLNDGRWHRVQCIKAPTAIQLVVDGKVFTQPANVGAIANPAPVVIGARPGGDWYSGVLDEVSIQIG